MSINRMPLMMYSTATTSILVVVALPALSVACIFLELQRNWGFHFFDSAYGGSPLMWQHIFWFFGHPWVYIIFLPATGMISMILPVMARRPIVGYAFVAVSSVLTGVVGMGVWVHHMFAVGMNTMAMSFFAAASMTISIFSAVQVFAWLATLWYGKPIMTAAMHFAIGFIALFIIGGLNGVVTAIIPFDWQLTDTYFVVAHLHYVLVGANVFPVMAALYYWFPKMSGRLLGERMGRWSFWLMFVGMTVAFLPMHVTGLEVAGWQARRNARRDDVRDARGRPGRSQSSLARPSRRDPAVENRRDADRRTARATGGGYVDRRVGRRRLFSVARGVHDAQGQPVCGVAAR
jgi:heme/copper-type cytochrome/quinol oxidase subunit 1